MRRRIRIFRPESARSAETKRHKFGSSIGRGDCRRQRNDRRRQTQILMSFSVFISAAATSAAPGAPRAVTSRSPRRPSARSRWIVIYWNSTRTAPAASSRCASCPKAKRWCSDSITTKEPTLESEDELVRRIEQAAKYVPMENLALSTQCGFASAASGNLISWDDMRRKLELVAKVAHRCGMTDPFKSSSVQGPAGSKRSNSSNRSSRSIP